MLQADGLTGAGTLPSMILRVTRSRVIPGNEERVLNVLRTMSASMGDSIRGLHSAVFGRAMGPDERMSLVAITTWESVDAIRAVYGERWAERSILPGAEEYILETTVEHFEVALADLTDLVERRRRDAGFS